MPRPAQKKPAPARPRTPPHVPRRSPAPARFPIERLALARILDGPTACCERQRESIYARLADGASPAALAHAYSPDHNRPCPYCNDPHPLTHAKDGS